MQFSTSNTTDYTSGGRLKIEDAKTASFVTNGQSVTFANALAVGTLKTGGLTKLGTGALTLTALFTLLTLLGLPQPLKETAQGLILIAAVAFGAWRRRRVG